MVMTLNLGFWETYSLTAGCNLYTSKFYLCVQNVKSVAEQQFVQIYYNNQNNSKLGASNANNNRKTTAMYFHEPEKSLVPTETFLATAVPKLLMTSLIIFLNILAIITLIRSNRWTSSFKSSFYSQNTAGKRKTGSNSYYFILPQSTQGLLHSLFTNYLLFGLVNLYSQVSLSVFLLGDNVRLVDDQGKECLVVNCLLITFSCSIALHLISLAVDRTLASYLSFKKYSAMSQGTVPLWLLSIWLPSIILGSLPLAGWRKGNFSFCVFVYQFNDDYLRFVSCFFLTCICLIPCLYLYFLIFLKPRSASVQRRQDTIKPESNYNTYNSNANSNTIEQQQPRVVVYRWYRKLQAHHRLTFTLILIVNILCWTPFHIYLLMACQSCPYSYLSANGFIMEYIFMITLIPSLVIPLLFSLRSSFMEKCASKIVRCVTFKNDCTGYGTGRKRTRNPLSYSSSSPSYLQKSSLFFIDDIQHAHQSSSNASFSSSALATTSRSGESSSNIILKSDKETNNNNTFFVPHYLPKDQVQMLQEKSQQHHHNRQNRERDHVQSSGVGIVVPAQVHNYGRNTNSSGRNHQQARKKKKMEHVINSKNNNGGTLTNKYKSSFKCKYDSYSLNKTLPLRHFAAYLNNGAEFGHEAGLADCCARDNENNGSSEYFNQHQHTYDSLESDMKYGFPIWNSDQPATNEDDYGNKHMARSMAPDGQNIQQKHHAVNDGKRNGIYYNSDDDDGLIRSGTAVPVEGGNKW